MGNYPMMEDGTDVVEQNDGFTSPLQQYESFLPSDVAVAQPDGPMWWDSTGPAEAVYAGEVEVTEEFPGGIVEVADPDPAATIEVVGADVITVLE